MYAYGTKRAHTHISLYELTEREMESETSETPEISSSTWSQLQQIMMLQFPLSSKVYILEVGI